MVTILTILLLTTEINTIRGQLDIVKAGGPADNSLSLSLSLLSFSHHSHHPHSTRHQVWPGQRKAAPSSPLFSRCEDDGDDEDDGDNEDDDEDDDDGCNGGTTVPPPPHTHTPQLS